MSTADKADNLKERLIDIRTRGYNEDGRMGPLWYVLGIDACDSDYQKALLIHFITFFIDKGLYMDIVLMALGLLKGYEEVTTIGERRAIFLNESNFIENKCKNLYQDFINGDEKKRMKVMELAEERLRNREDTRIEKLAIGISKVNDLPAFIKDVPNQPDYPAPSYLKNIEERQKSDNTCMSGSDSCMTDGHADVGFMTDAVKGIIFNESKKSFNNMRGLGGRFYHLNISDTILPGISDRFIETNIKINDTDNYSLKFCLEHLWSNECKHAFLVGEGGMGKTVSLIKLWEQYLSCGKNMPVPVFIALNEYNNANEDEKRSFIMNCIGREYLGRKNLTRQDENQLWDLLRNPDNSEGNEKPSAILLLDGFNEVTVERTGLLVELNSMIKNLKGVQIVITSRLDIRENLNWSFFNKLDLFPLNDQQIHNYLTTQNNTHIPNGKLLNLVRNPMMLTIYAATCHVIENIKDNETYKFKENIQTAGELLWNFIESQLVKNSENYGKGFFHSFLLKHLLPYIGWEMETRGKFSFSLNELMECVNHACEKLNSSEFYKTFPMHMEYTDKLCLGKSSGIEEIKKFNEIKGSLVNELVMLVEEKKEYRFLHQNFRDYFAAVHILNEIEIFLNSGGDLPTAIKEHVISYYVRRLIGEIEGEHYNVPIKDEKNEVWSAAHYISTIITKLLDKCRRKFDGSLGYTVWNIIEIWKDVRGELTGCDLSYLDLDKISLNEVRCSRLYGENYLAASFNGSRLFEQNMLFQGHSDVVKSAMYSPDGGRIISASGDSIKVWDARTFECLQTLYGHSSWVFSATYSPDGSRIVSASVDHTIKVWDTQKYECLQTLQGHSECVNSVVYSPDGSCIVSASDDKTIKIWDARTFECLQTLYGHSSWVSSAAYSPDGSRIISASGDNTIKIWDAQTFECLQTLEGHSESVSCVEYSPDSRYIVSASRDKTIKVWDARTFECLQTLYEHSSWVSSAAYSPDGSRIISASCDKTIKVWDVRTYECIQTIKENFSDVNNAVYSPDSSCIVSASDDKTIKIWDAQTYECLQTLQGHSDGVCSVSYSLDGRRIAFASEDGEIKVWDPQTYKCLQILKGHSSRVFSTGYSPDGNRIFSASEENTIKVWNTQTYECLQTLQGHSDYVYSAAYSPDGRRIISASWDATIRIWDAQTFECLQILEGHFGRVDSVSFSPDGSRIVSASGDTIKVWNAHTFECLRTLKGHSDYFFNAVYSSDGRCIVSALEDKTIKVWDAQTFECLQTLEGHSDSVFSAVYSSDDRFIVSASKDKTIKVWDAQTYECLQTLEGHSDSVRCVAYSPDGNRIVSTSDDNTIKIWDAQTYECLEKIENIPGLLIQGCAFNNIKTSEELKRILKQYGAKNI